MLSILFLLFLIVVIIIINRRKNRKPVDNNVVSTKQIQNTDDKFFSSDKVKTLERLKELLDTGVITPEEFQKEKTDILNK